jgi:tRNA A-37 threonylcarbamoyl transferase component Bud32
MFAPARVGNVVAGKYRVERVLGRGGMGIVVAARHLRLAERVAIKFPLAELRDRSDVVDRLVREGRAAMRIRSEHVARVYDVGVLETGEPYLVMEYLMGRDLGATLTEGGPLPIDDAVEYVLQSLEALAEAHARGIVHRDLKPSNLFLTRRADGSPMVKVIDFGISKVTKVAGEATLTDTAAVLGSLPYMAPEQMRSGRESDTRSDIWALGATLHALLTGAPPFLAGSIVEIHERALLGPPPLRSLRPSAPAALEAILLRCMQRDPEHRYADVARLAEALAEVAPEHARISALRAARILAGSLLLEEMNEAWPPDLTARIAPGIANATGAPPTARSAAASWREPALPAQAWTGLTGTVPPVATTRATWSGFALRRARWIGLGATVVGAAVFAVAVLATRRREPSRPEPPPLAAARADRLATDGLPRAAASLRLADRSASTRRPPSSPAAASPSAPSLAAPSAVPSVVPSVASRAAPFALPASAAGPRLDHASRRQWTRHSTHVSSTASTVGAPAATAAAVPTHEPPRDPLADPN